MHHSFRVCILMGLVKIRAFNIWNTPNADWLQNSMKGEYCRNGWGGDMYMVSKNWWQVCLFVKTLTTIISGPAEQNGLKFFYCICVKKLCFKKILGKEWGQGPINDIRSLGFIRNLWLPKFGRYLCNRVQVEMYEW